MGGQQGIASHLRSHLSVSQDEVQKDGEDRFACGALDTPDRETTQADTGVIGVTRQAPTSATGRLMLALEAKGHEKGEDTFQKRLAVAKQLKIGRFIVEIDSDGAVFAWPFGCVTHVSPPRLSGLGSEGIP